MEEMGHAIMGYTDTPKSSGSHSSETSSFDSNRVFARDPLDELIGGHPIKLVIY